MLNREIIMSDSTEKDSVTGSLDQTERNTMTFIPLEVLDLILAYSVPENMGLACDRDFRDMATSDDAKALVMKRHPNLVFNTFTILAGRNRWTVNYTYFPKVSDLLKIRKRFFADRKDENKFRGEIEPCDEYLLQTYSVLKIHEISEAFGVEFTF